MPFRQGNSKLGRKIWTFSIPAGDTCPGKTEACSKECYAAEGFFLMPNVVKSLQKNWNETLSPNFVEDSVNELKRVGARVCRVHVAGDIYNKEYAEKWLQIFQQVSDCRFFIYTRSWRVDDIRPVIIKMSKLKNVKMWWSVDKDTGNPRHKPKSVRLAYMQVEVKDIPSYKVDLIFRVDRLREIITKKVDGALVCPVENGITKDMNCMKCGYCWRNKDEVMDWSRVKNKISLSVLV